MDYKQKYLKYKAKYLELRNQMYGGTGIDVSIDTDPKLLKQENDLKEEIKNLEVEIKKLKVENVKNVEKSDSLQLLQNRLTLYKLLPSNLNFLIRPLLNPKQEEKKIKDIFIIILKNILDVLNVLNGERGGDIAEYFNLLFGKDNISPIFVATKYYIPNKEIKKIYNYFLIDAQLSALKNNKLSIEIVTKILIEINTQKSELNNLLIPYTPSVIGMI
jgi:hypothetical protein